MANKGLKSYTKQISQEIGEVGKVFVNVNKEDANLHILIPLITTLGPNPIDISLIFNYQDINKDKAFGKGCNLSTYKDIKAHTTSIDITDADGSMTIYELDHDEEYKSKESSLRVSKGTIYLPGDGDYDTFTIEDQQGNYMYYDENYTWYPTTIRTKGLPTRLDGPNMDNNYGAKITFTETSHSMYSKATYTQDDTEKYYVDFIYDSNKRLTNVKHYKETKCIKHLSISYGTNEITIKDEISKDYAKYTFSGNCVTKIVEVLNNTLENAVETSISYEDRRTTLTDNDGRKVYIYFDNDNFPLFEIDEDGNAIETKYDNITKKLISRSSILSTKTIAEAAKQISIDEFEFESGISIQSVKVEDSVFSNIVHNAYKISGKGKLRYSYTVDGIGNESYMAAIWGKFEEGGTSTTKVECTLLTDGFDSDFFQKTKASANFDLMTLGVSSIKSFSNVTLIIELLENTTITIGGIQILKKNYGSLYHYDETGNLVKEERANGSIMAQYYNGNKESVAGSSASMYFFDYDTKGNVTKAVASYGGKVENTYDDENNLTKRTISNASGTRKIEIINEYEEDKRSLKSQTDEFGNKTRYTYDSFGRIKTIIDALNATTEYKYNAFDSLTKILFNNVEFVDYVYDAQNRLETATLTNGTKYSFGYDTSNHLDKVYMNDVLIVSFIYDQDTGLIKNQKYGVSGDILEFLYTKKHMISQIKVNNDLKYQYEYDDYDQMRQVKDGSGTIIRTYAYDNDGQLTKTEEQESTIEYSYDHLGEVNRKKRTLNSKMIYETLDSVSKSERFSPDHLVGYLQSNEYIMGTMFTLDAKLKNTKYMAIPYDYNTGKTPTITYSRKEHIPAIECSIEYPICYNPPACSPSEKNSGCIALWFYPTKSDQYLFTITGENKTSIRVSITSSGRLELEIFNSEGYAVAVLTNTCVNYNDWNFVGLNFSYRSDGEGYGNASSFELYLNEECLKTGTREPILTEKGLYHIGYRYTNGKAEKGFDSYITALMIGLRREISSSHMKQYYRVTKDYILNRNFLDSEGQTVNFSIATLYNFTDTTKNQFKIYPLNNSIEALDGSLPKVYDVRKETSTDQDRSFKYNQHIKRYAYVADGSRLEFEMQQPKALTTMMRAIIHNDKDKQYFLELKKADNTGLGLYRGSDKYLYIDISGSSHKTNLFYESNQWHTIGLSFNIAIGSNSVTTYDIETIRIYLDGKTYSIVLNYRNHSPAILSIGRDKVGSYPLYGQIEMLSIRNAYCEESTLNTLAAELKSTTKVNQYDDTGLLYKKEIFQTDKSLLKHIYTYRKGFSKIVASESIAYSNIHPFSRSYSYDNLNRIEKISDTTFGTHTFRYNARGFLEQEDSTEYGYDSNGNITKAGTTAFTYDSKLKDRLKTVNGKEITYGTNPLQPISYNGNTYEWEGRRLVKYNNYTYTYNDLGLRTSKINNGSTTKYYYDGNKLITEDRPGCKLDFLYDENDQLYGFIYHNNKRYYYIRDFMQNILGIIDDSGNLVVKYNYTAYGTITSITGTLASTIGAYNPFRYKGYYYDTESKMYYCESRYYNPEWCRFISPDSIEYLDLSNINGMNLYAYCGNDPVNYKQGPVTFGCSVISSSVCVVGSFVLTRGSSVGGKPSALWWASTSVGAIPDFILGIKYLAASGMHSKFAYVTSTRYMHPILGGTWRWFGKSNSNFGTIVQGTFKQILTGDARAGFGAIAKSVGNVVGLNALVNFGFNLYENNWQIDSTMLVDTAIDTAIGVSSYYLAAGAMSFATAGLLATGVALPGIVVVGGTIILSIGFEHVIRAISGYWD